MKKIFYLFITAALLSAVILACQDKVPVSGIKMNKDSFPLAVGGTTTLTVEILPLSATNKTITWSTSNSSVATVVDNTSGAALAEGLVTGKAEGTAIITATTKDGKHSTICTVRVINAEPELILVEGGPFTMGCIDGNCDDGSNELPVHEVTLSSYKITKYAVTQQQWEAVMGDNPSRNKGDGLPVESVSWHRVQEFIQKLNTFTGKSYRLPTEAEWEYAARGGRKSTGKKYSGSDNIEAVAWYSSNSGNKTHPVGTKAPNELGIYDMSGNVLEWCSDWYGTYIGGSQTNPTGPISGTMRIVRGGSALNFGANGCRVSFRTGTLPSNSISDLGFRLVHP
ncbi:MAG: SUMF1/EgtB/PvdO family nonheme iron enzyme [Bacteroidetes bacterium]|nr:SUMF1/EgtB/PvdO family nonheme iron enzyme [Bacteroidota bacterium]